jgi:thiamine biosynthesis lipoprotein
LSATPEPVTLARHAMATRFEIVLHGGNPVALRAAGEEALDEIERIEALLSLYRDTSEIAHVNARAAREPVRVSLPVFRLLEQARSLNEETGGAFDITIAPLVRCWGFMGGTGQMPEPEAVAAAREKVGWNLVQLDRANFTVRFAREGVMLDLGAIGKGYAIERAAEILREDGVTSAILHGGTSTVHAIGCPPDAGSWKVAIERPVENPTSPPPLLATVPLKDESLSVSAVWGRSFQSGDKTYGHVIDPRSGQPTEAALLAAVVLSSATETDALSTALLTLGVAALHQITALRAGSRCLVVSRQAGRIDVESTGIACVSSASTPPESQTSRA